MFLANTKVGPGGNAINYFCVLLTWKKNLMKCGERTYLLYKVFSLNIDSKVIQIIEIMFENILYSVVCCLNYMTRKNKNHS